MVSDREFSRAWDAVVEDPDAGTEQLEPTAAEALPRNGLRILGATSLLNGTAVHEWTHDGRHLLGFPCH